MGQTESARMDAKAPAFEQPGGRLLSDDDVLANLSRGQAVHSDAQEALAR